MNGIMVPASWLMMPTGQAREQRVQWMQRLELKTTFDMVVLKFRRSG
jgi:hypothetical protein